MLLLVRILKGQSHEIFELWFFQELVTMKQFRFWSRFHGYIGEMPWKMTTFRISYSRRVKIKLCCFNNSNYKHKCLPPFSTQSIRGKWSLPVYYTQKVCRKWRISPRNCDEKSKLFHGGNLGPIHEKVVLKSYSTVPSRREMSI